MGRGERNTRNGDDGDGVEGEGMEGGIGIGRKGWAGGEGDGGYCIWIVWKDVATGRDARKRTGHNVRWLHMDAKFAPPMKSYSKSGRQFMFHLCATPIDVDSLVPGRCSSGFADPSP